MWLVLDEIAIERYFGYGPAARDLISAFAKQNGCTLVRDDSKPEVKFGRAYYKLELSDISTCESDLAA